MPVRILPPKVRDQIAAGEVIERPASVLKELLENALDAGARRIAVELAAGGRSLLRVVDDGCGMGREDLALAVERFATSKLQSAEELAVIQTLGFRGEALPAIGSVSRLTITSRARGAESGWRLAVEGGEKSGPEPAGAAPGTAVEVRDLFYNLPARQKFLKSPRAELDRCLAALTALALARFEAAFTVEHDGRTILELPAAERLADRVAGLCGARLVESLVEADAQLGSGARCRGLVGLPTEHRPNGADAHVFVNRRPVRDRAVSAAVNAAYTGLLPLRRYPVTFLFLEFPPAQVDINVHPTKAEVRFVRPGEVFALIERAVRSGLARAELAAAGDAEPYGRPALEALPDGPDGLPLSAAAAPAMAPPARAERPRSAAPPAPAAPRAEQPRLDLWGRAPGAERGAGNGERGTENGEFRAPSSELRVPVSSESRVQAAAAAPGRLVGQALDGFLVVERGDGLMIIDQHALHERMLYEELRAARTGPAPSQGLVIPQAVELSARHAQALGQSRAELSALGFDLEGFGGRSFLVRAAPAALRLSDLAGYLVELAEELCAADEREAARSEEERRERLLAAVACKAAVKAGERLSREAAEDLARRGLLRLGAGMARTCPHGRPIFFLLDRAELARRVGRK